MQVTPAGMGRWAVDGQWMGNWCMGRGVHWLVAACAQQGHFAEGRGSASTVAASGRIRRRSAIRATTTYRTLDSIPSTRLFPRFALRLRYCLPGLASSLSCPLFRQRYTRTVHTTYTHILSLISVYTRTHAPPPLHPSSLLTAFVHTWQLLSRIHTCRVHTYIHAYTHILSLCPNHTHPPPMLPFRVTQSIL